MNDTDRAWLAGLFEGEGSIYISPKTVSVKINMTDRDVIEKVHALFPAPSGIWVHHPTCAPRRKTQYVWNLRRAEAVREFLPLILPWLAGRRTQKAREALAFLDTRPGISGDPANRAKTHCLRGHPFDGDNLYINKRGGRHCKTCMREHSRERMTRVRADAAARPYDPAEPWHGTTGGYTNWACRCDACKTANSAYNRAYRQRRLAAVSSVL